MSQSTASLQTERQDASATMPGWRTELNAKLEAHRRRREPADAGTSAAPSARESFNEPEGSSSRATAARVAARVAARYAHAPTYSEVLAARSAAASAAAGAAATAAQQAHAAAQDLLSSLAKPGWEHTEGESHGRDGGFPSASLAMGEERAGNGGWQARRTTVEHPEPLPARMEVPPRAGATFSGAGTIVDAFAEAEVPPATSLPAKLIEFPRELVAAQRARPRLAEGPLVEEEEAGLLPLRIFEVHTELEEPGWSAMESGSVAGALDPCEPTLARTVQPELEVQEPGLPNHGQERREEAYGSGRSGRHADGEAPGWQSIRLGEHPRTGAEELTLQHRVRAPEAEVLPAPVLFVAPLPNRLMAALVDLGLVAGGFLLFVFTFAACTTHPPTGRIAALCCGVVFVALAVFYQWLFMSYGGGTPGMRYARIALCTFDDNNPTRAMLRSRMWAGILVALPLGLGFLWALFDEELLGWHDRLTRTYQRSY